MNLPARPLERPPLACDEARELLSAQLDGEVDEAEARALDEHLAGCQRCESERRRLEAVRSAFRALPVAAPPDDLGREVLDRIQREGGRLTGGRFAGRPASPRRRAAWVAMIATALATVAVATTLWWHGGDGAWPGASAVESPAAPGRLAGDGLDGVPADLGADAGCGPEGDCFHLAPCDSPAECGGGPPCSNPGECDGDQPSL